MSDYIERQAVIDAVHEEFDGCTVWDESGKRTADEVESIIDRVPSASVVPVEELKAEIYKLKHQSEQSFGNHDYHVGYISALSTVEGILAVMDREE